MLHQLSLARLPSFGGVERLVPPEVGARVSGALLHLGQLVFRGARGIYAGAHGQLLHPDPPGARYFDPRSAGRLIVARRGRPTVPVIAEAIVFLRDGAGEVCRVIGQSVAIDRHGRVAVVADRRLGLLSRVDLETLEVRVVGRLSGALDPRDELPMALSDDGRSLLYAAMLAERAGCSLMRLELDRSTEVQVGAPVVGPSWTSGTFLPDGRVVATRMRLAPTPRFEMSLEGRSLLELDSPQPSDPPSFVAPDHLALVLSPSVPRCASYGPSDLFLIPLRAGVRVQLSTLGDVRGRTRVDDAAIWVEGGPQVLRVARGSGSRGARTSGR